jgi:nucleotide-binding universal stress UspA family protein
MNTTLEQRTRPSPATEQARSPDNNSSAVNIRTGRHRTASVKIQTILVPLDFSRPAMQAFDYAVTLAKKLGAKIEMIHVQLPDEACAAPGAGHLIRECAEATALIHKRLGQLDGEKRPQFWPENCRIRTGHPYEEICKVADELNVDLIVLGSRGNTGLKRVLLGSTTERVVRFAPCPVLVVRKWRRTNLPIRKILVPTDFSQCAMAGAIYAAPLAKALNATMHLFNVVFPISPVLIDRVAMNLPIDNTLAMREARLNMQGLSKLDLFKGVKCRGVVRSGYVIDMICSETAGADLVVISTHGRTGFKHALMGSVAEQVMRYSQCPVLVVPGSHAPSS